MYHYFNYRRVYDYFHDDHDVRFDRTPPIRTRRRYTDGTCRVPCASDVRTYELFELNACMHRMYAPLFARARCLPFRRALDTWEPEIRDHPIFIYRSRTRSLFVGTLPH